jgi:hypothetical protein
LDRATKVFALAGNLGRPLEREKKGQNVTTDPPGWNRLAAEFDQFWRSLLEVREPAQRPPDGLDAVANQLEKANDIAEGIRQATQSKGRLSFAEHLDFFPDLNHVGYDGRQAVKDATTARLPDNHRRPIVTEPGDKQEEAPRYFVVAAQATCKHPVTGEILPQPVDDGLAEVVAAAVSLNEALPLLEASPDQRVFAFHQVAFFNDAAKFRQLFDFGDEIGPLQGLATCCPLPMTARAFVADILTALDEIEKWSSQRVSNGTAFPTSIAQSITAAVTALREALARAERSKLPRKPQPPSGQFIPVKLPEIVTELRAACDRVMPMREDLPGVHDLIYWPGIRESLKRLHELLPADIDRADCDASIREQLRNLRALVIEIWDAMRLGDTSRSRPHFLYSGYRERLGSILDRLPELKAHEPEHAAAVTPDASDRQQERSAGSSASQELATKSKRSTARGDRRTDDQPLSRLIRFYTNGVSDDRIQEALIVLEDERLTTNEKLRKIDGLMPVPASASAQQLGKLLRVTKQAVMKTDWWIRNRTGEKENEIGRRRSIHMQRAAKLESAAPTDNDD